MCWLLVGQWLCVVVWMLVYVQYVGYVDEVVVLLLVQCQLCICICDVVLQVEVSGLLGEYVCISNGMLVVLLDDFFVCLQQYLCYFVLVFYVYQVLCQSIIGCECEILCFFEFKVWLLLFFVCNKLINDVYLGVIGDNLVKQMGMVGENKCSDLMGLLMMILFLGYGKIMLMEYVVYCLGLVFMKINGLVLGYEVCLLDLVQVLDVILWQELEKFNLVLEMGNNIMLYVDDIQYIYFEFLQKFILLCDGICCIEGVWCGCMCIYDMCGKKFCVVMVGNLYIEFGEVFKILDMLVNCVDIYNFGDVFGGMEVVFIFSYIENSLIFNLVLVLLVICDMVDLYVLVDCVMGKEVLINGFSYVYSSVEINEIIVILQCMLCVCDVVYWVNQQYIVSVVQDDCYCIELLFCLQGSYCNMNKLVEKIFLVMNEDELQQLIFDYYLGEVQLLIIGVEENLLKLVELCGVLDDMQVQCWVQIKCDFLCNKVMGVDDSDVGGCVVVQLVDIVIVLQLLLFVLEVIVVVDLVLWLVLLEVLDCFLEVCFVVVLVLVVVVFSVLFMVLVEDLQVGLVLLVELLVVLQVQQVQVLQILVVFVGWV